VGSNPTLSTFINLVIYGIELAHFRFLLLLDLSGKQRSNCNHFVQRWSTLGERREACKRSEDIERLVPEIQMFNFVLFLVCRKTSESKMLIARKQNTKFRYKKRKKEEKNFCL
jgi:hypothetical protein